MKLNEMLSSDIGNLIFVLQILSILDEFFFFSHSADSFQRCVVFLMTEIFEPLSKNKVWVTSATSGNEFMAVNTSGVNRYQFKWNENLGYWERENSRRQRSLFHEILPYFRHHVTTKWQNRERILSWLKCCEVQLWPPPRRNCNKNVWL